jgi:hypothetical protein
MVGSERDRLLRLGNIPNRRGMTVAATSGYRLTALLDKPLFGIAKTDSSGSPREGIGGRVGRSGPNRFIRFEIKKSLGR